ETETPVQDFLRRAVVLELLRFVAVLHDAVVLPPREERHRDEQRRAQDRADELPFLLRVDFAYNGVVADVLLDCVLYVHANAVLPTARSRDLRARGFRLTSSSPGTMGFRVSSRTVASGAGSGPRPLNIRKVRFTIRSSSE